MTNIIRFLETLGADPAAGRMSAANYVAAVAALQVEDTQRQALLDRDTTALSQLLGGRGQMLCALMTPGQQEPNEREESPADGEGDEDEKDPSERQRQDR